MTIERLGTLKRLDARTVWRNEASEFTPWLIDHIAILNEELGLEIDPLQREAAVGDFKLDVFGRDLASGREVIIENQLEATDHNHLGQLLTYAAGLEAKIVIWIAPQFRDEHRQALDWLNLQTDEDVSFFGIEVELLQVDDSLPAAHFKVVVQPNEWQKQAASSKKPEVSPRRAAYHEFFTDLLSKLKSSSPGYTTSNRVGYDSWMQFGAGRSGFSFNPAFAGGNQFRVELYIDGGDYDANKAAFDELESAKDQIEEAVGEPLTWQRLDERRACRIYVHRDASINSPPETLDGLKEWAVEQLLKFRDVFGPRVKSLRLEGHSESEDNSP